ncbi:hypothetical protein EA472_20655 [Natrarchaeobius oligotrophus]|uniref:Uncharacterized protein n=1 Tax=Natrarchaeobius chitinivorans TaxID=1679083 RepID=A0A3N6PFB1_NATCH|nr:hypothetical protein EA472_20655 [Natrarchaeobius chitinivorans]
MRPRARSPGYAGIIRSDRAYEGGMTDRPPPASHVRALERSRWSIERDSRTATDSLLDSETAYHATGFR